MGSVFKLARTENGALFEELEPELSRLWMPVLVLWGEADPLTPLEYGRHLARLLPSSDLVVFPGVGHLLPEEAPGLVASQIQSFHRRTAAQYH